MEKNKKLGLNPLWSFLISVSIAVAAGDVYAKKDRGTDQESSSEISIPQKFKDFKVIQEDDKIPWEFETKEPVYALSDVHGNYLGTFAILKGLGLIDDKGDWKKDQKAHLVVVGDLFHGQSDSRLIIEMLMRLQMQSKKAGGMVHVVLGNHDLRVAHGEEEDFNKDKSEKEGYSQYAVCGHHYNSPREVFLNSEYADWIASLNQIVKINDRIFVHAGLEAWALLDGVTPEKINTTGRRWIRYWQDQYKGKNQVKMPDDNTRWVVGLKDPEEDHEDEFDGAIGPTWSREFKAFEDKKGNLIEEKLKGAPKVKVLKAILKKWKASGVIVGHAPTPTREVILKHPYYDEMVVMIDTKIAEDEGKLGCIKITSDNSASKSEMKSKVQSFIFERLKKKAGEEVRSIEITRLEESEKDPGGASKNCRLNFEKIGTKFLD